MRLKPEEAGAKLEHLLPCTRENIDEVHELLLAPWVKLQSLDYLEVAEGRIKARLRQDGEQQFFAGVICGQALMSAIDTVMSLAMLTYPRSVKGTASQNTHFLRPAVGEDLILEATVLKMGKQSAYGETRVIFEGSGTLVAHATSDYAL